MVRLPTCSQLQPALQRNPEALFWSYFELAVLLGSKLAAAVVRGDPSLLARPPATVAANFSKLQLDLKEVGVNAAAVHATVAASGALLNKAPAAVMQWLKTASLQTGRSVSALLCSKEHIVVLLNLPDVRDADYDAFAR